MAQASASLLDALDSPQQRALSRQLVNAFAALCASAQATRASPAALACISALVMRTAQSACSLATIERVVQAVARSAAIAPAATRLSLSNSTDDDDSAAVDAETHVHAPMCADTVLTCMDAIVSERVLEHPDLHARAGDKWAAVLSSIADVVAALLATDAASARPVSNVAQRKRAKQTLEQLKSVLDQVPALKLRVLERAAHTRLAYAALL